jgi:hypothetical protein
VEIHGARKKDACRSGNQQSKIIAKLTRLITRLIPEFLPYQSQYADNDQIARDDIVQQLGHYQNKHACKQ